MSEPLSQTSPDAPKRDPSTGRVLPGNQIARKYPKPPAENDPEMALRLAERREQAIADRGGTEQLTATCAA